MCLWSQSVKQKQHQRSLSLSCQKQQHHHRQRQHRKQDRQRQQQQHQRLEEKQKQVQMQAARTARLGRVQRWPLTAQPQLQVLWLRLLRTRFRGNPGIPQHEVLGRPWLHWSLQLHRHHQS